MLNKIKYLALDLDGTLLNSKKEIGIKSRENILRLNKIGVPVLFATGRHFREVTKYIEETQIKDSYVICCDGQYVYRTDGICIYQNKFLSKNDVLYISDFLNLKNLSFYTDKYDFYVNNFFSVIFRNVIKYIRKNHKIKNLTKWQLKYFAKSEILDQIEKIVFYKANISSNLSKLQTCYNVHVLGNNRVEILNHDVSKLSALSWLHEKKFIDINSLLYIGDDYNDIECFMNIKNCAAMGNAPNKIKNLALCVTDTNDNDGVGKVIEKYILK